MAADKTIYALASAPGRAGVAVLRVSGPDALSGLQSLGGPKNPSPRMAHLCALKAPNTGDHLDKALILYFKAPHSYTGQDVVEYHLHGGKAVIDSVLVALSESEGHVMAQPGEFTRRAFENDKIDLTEAEAIADLIDAETQAQKHQALAQMGGALSDLYHGWSDQLSKALAHLEADIEFPDEDMPGGIAPQVTETISDLIGALGSHLDDKRRGERLRSGIHIAVIGAPNVGKSSFVNALARRDIAIVSDQAGTTRDVVEAHIDLAGYPVILSDTAGLRPDQLGEEGHEGIESEGIRRALERAETADLKILMFDSTQPDPDAHTLNLIDDRSIIVLNKIDDVLSNETLIAGHGVSVKTGAGMSALLRSLEENIKDSFGQLNAEPVISRQRHRVALQDALQSLLRAEKAPLPELTAEDMRLALRALGRITGAVDVEDLLDIVFNDFCIGK